MKSTMRVEESLQDELARGRPISNPTDRIKGFNDGEIR